MRAVRSRVGLLVAGVMLLAATPVRADLAPGLVTGLTLPHGGGLRSYDLFVPSGYDGTPLPLLVDLHAAGSSAAGERAISGFQALADAQGVLIAWPQGTGSTWNGGICCAPAWPSTDDVGFLRAVVADVATRVALDATRVYATGYANGGLMAHRLACEAADVFAAVAPFASPMSTPFEACRPSRPVAVLHTHGLDDTVVPYGGGPVALFPGVTAPATPDGFHAWAQADGCCTNCLADPVSEPSTITDDRGDADPATRCEAYSACDGGVEVALCSERAGHVSPGGTLTTRAWRFLARFPAGAAPTTTTTTLPSDGCPPAPRTDCVPPVTATASVLHLRGGAPDARKLVWKWTAGGPVAPALLGDPTTVTPYALCVYVDDAPVLAAEVPAAATCDGAACWTGLGTPAGVGGWKLVDRPGRHDGLTKIFVRPGTVGRPKAVVSARGAGLAAGPFGFPTLPLATPPRVQLVAIGGGCVEARMRTTVAAQVDRYVVKGGY